MAVLKCKMCGGALEIGSNESVATCEYCGSVQTLPKDNNDVIANLFNRANNLRIKSEFDKAAEVYEKIISKDNTEAEAYWGLVLCKYGVEYVEDPTTFKRIPTCHRTQYESILTDVDFLAVIENADTERKTVYQAQAEEIAALQKDILEIVKKEKPFDVFICYKETDENGKRTIDSALANDIYYQLKQEGLKVFYAAITLEDKLGQEYEPYIFAALNSAKVMLVVGTKPEYFEAVWVKNEWSRYLKLMKNDRSKLLIPCYRDMDAYDLPEEFSHLQAQDMSKIGFVNDVVRGIKKIVSKPEEKKPVSSQPVAAAPADGNIAPLLERVFMFLEDCDWTSADEYCEKVLDIDPKCAQAYLGKLMARRKVRRREQLRDCSEPFDTNNNYLKAIRFGDEKLKNELEECIRFINERNETKRLENIYNGIVSRMSVATKSDEFAEAAEQFNQILDYKDSADLQKECRQKAEDTKKDEILSQAEYQMVFNLISSQNAAIELLQSIPGWKNADELIEECNKKIESLKAAAEAERIKAEENAQKAKKIIKIVAPVVAAVLVLVLLINNVIIPAGKYRSAEKLMEEGKYVEAIDAFAVLEDYKDSAEMIELVKQKQEAEKVNAEEAKKEKVYNEAVTELTKGNKLQAAMLFGKLSGYRDASSKSFALWDEIAVREMISAGNNYTVGLKNDGTAIGVGSNADGKKYISGWSDIAAISAGRYDKGCHTVGLKKDGTVVAVGNNDYGQRNVSDWTDIVAISTSSYHTVGLKKDGTVVAVGYNTYGQCNVYDWKDIIAISAGYYHTVGLKKDGTVVAVGTNSFGQCDISYWTDIVAISAGEFYTVGLKKDGTVVAVGDNDDGQCDVGNWRDIAAISAGTNHTVGLKKDGTVVAVGNNYNGQCDISDWQNIVAISAESHTVGLKKDGTVVAVGYNDKGQCNVSDWTDIQTP